MLRGRIRRKGRLMFGVSKTQSGRVDRGHFSLSTHVDAECEDRAWWHRATAETRWQAVEIQRMIAYAYETPPRLQRFLEIAEK